LPLIDRYYNDIEEYFITFRRQYHIYYFSFSLRHWCRYWHFFHYAIFIVIFCLMMSIPSLFIAIVQIFHAITMIAILITSEYLITPLYTLSYWLHLIFSFAFIKTLLYIINIHYILDYYWYSFWLLSLLLHIIFISLLPLSPAFIIDCHTAVAFNIDYFHITPIFATCYQAALYVNAIDIMPFHFDFHWLISSFAAFAYSLYCHVSFRIAYFRFHISIIDFIIISLMLFIIIIFYFLSFSFNIHWLVLYQPLLDWYFIIYWHNIDTLAHISVIYFIFIAIINNISLYCHYWRSFHYYNRQLQPLHIFIIFSSLDTFLLTITFNISSFHIITFQ